MLLEPSTAIAHVAHAPLAPSAAERWIACPGSVAAERALPPAPASDFADEGTRAHAIFAEALLSGASPVALSSDDPVMAALLGFAVDLARQILGGRRIAVELRLPPLPELPDVWGTADVVAVADSGGVDTILDLKYGAGLPVEADAWQLGIYALLAARAYGAAPSGITVWVVQPRIPHPGGAARPHVYGVDALQRLERRLRQHAAATGCADAPRRAGRWCRFCAAAALCPEHQRTPDAVPALLSAAPFGWLPR